MLIPERVPPKLRGSDRSIPRVVHQTMKSRDVPARMFSAAESWWRSNPDCEYQFHDDSSCASFVADFDPDMARCFERVPPGAFRADIWRYCMLYQHGGIYADIDTVCRYSMDRLLSADDEFVIAHDANPSKLFNAFICTRPQSPILAAVLDLIRREVLADNWEGRLKSNPTVLYDITGPGGLASAAARVLGLPQGCSFYPTIYKGDACSMRVLRKLHKNPLILRRVMVGWRTIVMCKYPGYLSDLREAEVTHWQI
jgi:hypothetical protein